jgi:hypothetical protein
MIFFVLMIVNGWQKPGRGLTGHYRIQPSAVHPVPEESVPDAYLAIFGNSGNVPRS